MEFAIILALNATMINTIVVLNAKMDIIYNLLISLRDNAILHAEMGFLFKKKIKKSYFRGKNNFC